MGHVLDYRATIRAGIISAGLAVDHEKIEIRNRFADRSDSNRLGLIAVGRPNAYSST
jgi:hypothetical protein